MWQWSEQQRLGTGRRGHIGQRQAVDRVTQDLGFRDDLGQGLELRVLK